MILRRYTPEKMFEIVENSNLFDKNNKIKYKSNYIFIPRYNVGIQLKTKSISFFFNYIYKVRTTKTYIIWFTLVTISFFSFFKNIFKIFKIPFEIYSPETNNHLKGVDVLYAEWHFIGVYSRKKNTVIHLLSNSNYINRLENEVSARKICIKNKINVVPKLISYNISKNGYWHESIAVDKNKQFISDSDFILAQKKLCSIYDKTKKIVKLDEYYNNLKEKLNVITDEDINFFKNEIYYYIENNYLINDLDITLALVHGDFNKGQILKKDNNLIFIDWSDGGFLNVFFDIITITLNFGGENIFNKNFIPNELSILNEYFEKEISNPFINLYIALTLLEVLEVQFVEFEKQKGPYKRWTQQSKLFLKQIQNSV